LWKFWKAVQSGDTASGSQIDTHPPQVSSIHTCSYPDMIIFISYITSGGLCL